jgi:hypothetical protein
MKLYATQHYSEELIKTNSAKDFFTVGMIQSRKNISVFIRKYTNSDTERFYSGVNGNGNPAYYSSM